MAEEQIILDVKVNAADSYEQLNNLQNKIRGLKNEQTDLYKAIKEQGGQATAEQTKRLEEIAAQMDKSKGAAKALSAQIKRLNDDGKNYGDSLNEMRRKLNDMRAEYDGLSKAERENINIGGKLQTAIKEQHDAVLELEGATGRMQRNVGNYQKAFISAFPGFDKFNNVLEKMGLSLEDISGILKGFADKVGQSFSSLGNIFSRKADDINKGLNKIDSSVKIVGSDTLKTADTLGEVKDKMGDAASGGSKAFGELGKSVKAFGKIFLTPPIIIIAAIVGAIVLAFNKLKEAFAKSDDAGTALASGLAVMKPIGTAIGKVFDNLANIIGKLVEGMGSAVIAVAKLANAVGIGDGEFVKAAEDAKALVKATDDLEEQERQYTVSAAKNEKEISRLRLEAENERDPKKKKKLLDEAVRLEEVNLNEQQSILQKRLDNLKAKAKEEVDTSDDTKNKIAEAEAELARAEKASLDRRKEISGQLRAAKAAEAAAAKEAAQKQITIAQQLEDALLATIKDKDARAIAKAQIQGDREIAALKERLNTEKNLTAKAKEDLNALIIEKQRQLDEQIEMLSDEAANNRESEYIAQAQAAIDAENARHQALIEAKLANNEDDIELQRELMQLQFDAMLEQLDEQLQIELENKALSEEQKQVIEDEYRAIRAEKEKEFINKLTAIDKQYADNQKLTIAQAKEQMAQSFAAMAKNASNTFGQISNLLAQYGEQNEDAARASKAFAITKIITDQAISIADTAKAMAAAVAGATEAAAATGPLAPFTLAAYIAEMIGLVIGAVGGLAASFSSAKSILSSGSGNAGAYATGGIIGGSSYSGDRLTANVNSGEMILNKNQQARLFDIANGQGSNLFDYSLMTDAMVAAVAAQPAPVMAYSEFKDFQSRTATYDEFARI